jgi:hypothetical protein
VRVRADAIVSPWYSSNNPDGKFKGEPRFTGAIRLQVVKLTVGSTVIVMTQVLYPLEQVVPPVV